MDKISMIKEMQKSSDSKKLRGLFVLEKSFFEETYSSEDVDIIKSLVDIYAPLQTRDIIAGNPDILREADVIFSGWGILSDKDMPIEYLDNLKVLFYGAGSVKHFVNEKYWEKGVRVSSAAQANAVPVAEYTLAQILMAAKRCWYYAAKVKYNRTFAPSICDVPGAFNSTVGLVSLGATAKMLYRYLTAFDFNLIAYDPYISSEDLRNIDIKMTDLNNIFEKSDIVSLHSPLTNETAGLITGDHFMRMKYGATLINTARGGLIREDEMVDVLKRRPDMTVVLDVTVPEPPMRESLLYDLPNAIITPHIAGAMAGERRRLGRFVVDELRRYLSGRPLKGEIKHELLSIQA